MKVYNGWLLSENWSIKACSIIGIGKADVEFGNSEKKDRFEIYFDTFNKTYGSFSSSKEERDDIFNSVLEYIINVDEL